MIDKSQFSTKKELFTYLKEHKTELIAMKKAAIKFTDGAVGMSIDKDSALKALQTSTEGDTDTVIKRTLVGNTYLWMDSHEDVHLESTFTKSIKERGNEVFHLHDHEQKVTAKVGSPISVYEKEIDWSDLGVNKIGKTIALMMDSNIKKEFNPMVFNEYKSNEIKQHSVGMYYVKIDLAINDKDFEDEFKLWNTHINKLGNKEVAEKEGHFWAVQEAKLIEISAVLRGSNELTPTIEAVDSEPLKSTQQEPLKDTQTKTKKSSIHYY